MSDKYSEDFIRCHHVNIEKMLLTERQGMYNIKAQIIYLVKGKV